MAGTFSIPGVASGMDWGGMVDELIAKSQKAYEPMLTKRDNLERKISLYEEMNQAIRNLQTKLTSLKLPSIYKAKTTEMARLDSNGLPQTVLTATVTSDAKVMNYEIEVLQKAMTMSRYGKQLTGTNVGKDSMFYLNIGGKRAKITVAKTDTLEDIARKINNARDIQNPTVSLDVTAMVVDGQLVVRSTKTGAGSDSKLSQKITRSATGNDTMSFSPDLKNDIINGAVVVKGKGADGVERSYQYGLDFDIVGNEIRWRDYNPKAATAGSSYSLGYLPHANDRLAYQVTRGEGNYDFGVFSPHTFGIDTTGTKVDMPGYFDVSYNGTPYAQGTDFEIYADGLRWIGNRPPEGATYSVRYQPLLTEVWHLPAVTRNANDAPGMGTIVETSPSGVVSPPYAANAPTYADYRKYSGAAVITQGSRTWTEGLDFEMVSDGTLADGLQVKWKTEAGAQAPEPGSQFNLRLNYSSTSGLATTKYVYTNTLTRSNSDDFKFDTTNPPFESAPQGFFDSKIYADNGYEYNWQVGTPPVPAWQVSGSPNAIWNTPPGTIYWTPPSAASSLRPNLPQAGSEYTIEYTGNMNVFSFDDTGDGILDILGFANYTDPKNTNAQDAVVSINGGAAKTYSTNTIVFTQNDTVFDDEGNVVSLLGLTINVKGPGKVQIDVTQDAEKAVTAVQNYVDAYNELMDWINIRATEKAVDEAKKETLSGDDFRMKWGLLHGDQLLANTKGKLRALVSHSQPLGFQSRMGRDVLYGTLGDAGMTRDSLLTVRLGGEKSTIDVEITYPDGSKEKEKASVGGFAVQVMLSPGDTLQNAAEKINAALKYNYVAQKKVDPIVVPIYDNPVPPRTIIGYETIEQFTQVIPMGTAEVRNGRIVITSAFNEVGKEIPLMVNDNGSGVLKTLGLNDRYTMLSQIGISTGASTGEIGTNAKTGMLEFDTEKFIEAMTADADAVADLMVTNMKEMDKYLTSLASQTQMEFSSGAVGIQGRVSNQIDRMQQEIANINKYLAAADRRLEDKADALYRAYAAAEQNLAKLTYQANSVASALSMLTGATSNNSSS